jgi:hypothetical protein
MNVVIHAGIHRTGTTSLQLFLEGNRSALRERGILYPGETRNHQPLAWSLKRNPKDTTEIRKFLDSDPDTKTVLLSAEDFCIHTDLRWLKEIAGTCKTQAVFNLRRQDHWLMSWYNQHVKWPFDRNKSKMDKTEFLESIGDFHWLDYAALLQRWSMVLGEENVSVAVVEKHQVVDVVDDFVKRLGTPRDGLVFDDQRLNDSLPVHILEVARHLGMFDLPPKARIQLIRALRVGLANKSQPAGTVYSPEERNRVLQRFHTSNQEVARKFFGRDALFLEEPPAPDAPYFHFPQMDRQEFMREWINPVLKHLLPK